VKQILIGIPAGGLAGAVLGRSTKTTAIVVGTSVVVVAVANQERFIL